MKVLLLLALASFGCASRSEEQPAADAAATDAPAVCNVAESFPTITGDDPYAYPPYALDECSLVYVATDGSLHLADLGGSHDEVLDVGPARRPTLAGETVAWEATEGGASVVRVRHGADPLVTFKGGEPRAARDGVVFTRWISADANGDTDVLLYVPSTKQTITVAAGPGQQRFADVSDELVALTDFSEDPDGRFDGNATDLADIAIFDRATSVLTVRKRAGKQGFPLLPGGKALVYHDWASIHPQPKLEAYELWRGTVDAAVSADSRLVAVETQPPYVRPAGRGGVIEWVARDATGIALFRAPVFGTPVRVSGLDAWDLFAPATAGARTAIGVRTGTSASATLRILAR